MCAALESCSQLSLNYINSLRTCFLSQIFLFLILAQCVDLYVVWHGVSETLFIVYSYPTSYKGNPWSPQWGRSFKTRLTTDHHTHITCNNCTYYRQCCVEFTCICIQVHAMCYIYFSKWKAKKKLKIYTRCWLVDVKIATWDDHETFACNKLTSDIKSIFKYIYDCLIHNCAYIEYKLC